MEAIFQYGGVISNRLVSLDSGAWVLVQPAVNRVTLVATKKTSTCDTSSLGTEEKKILELNPSRKKISVWGGKLSARRQLEQRYSKPPSERRPRFAILDSVCIGHAHAAIVVFVQPTRVPDRLTRIQGGPNDVMERLSAAPNIGRAQAQI